MKNCLRQLREQKGMTQEEVARAVGVSRQTIIAIENDKYDPTLALAFRLSGFYGLPIEKIFLYEPKH